MKWHPSFRVVPAILSLFFVALLGYAGWYIGKYTAPKVHSAQVSPTPLVVSTPSPENSASGNPLLNVSAPELSTTPSPATQPALTGIRAKIAMYHYVRVVNAKKDPLGYRLSVTPEELDHQLTLFQSLGYHAMSMADLAAGKGDDHAIVFTFDDGYEDFYTNAYPIFKKHGWTATLYVISGKIGGDYLTWDQIRELHSAGFEIGAHTVNHRNLSTLTETQQKIEIIQSKQDIEHQINVPVDTFAYPSGQYNATTVKIVQDAGFTTAVTTAFGPVRATDPNPLLYTRYRMLPDTSDAKLTALFQD
jgi:peptidoglycan/xylan/chitin deacetylase (PgdA/CDA1 family)